MKKLVHLQIEGVAVEIDKTRLLDDISVTINRGEVLALVGHNGAGKSTLMRTVIGMTKKVSGKISVMESFDQDEQLLSFKKQICYLPEEPLLLTELTVMQHFQLYGMSYDINSDVLQKRITRFVEGFDLTTKLDEYPESLSKGMRQKTQAICALLPDVPILLIDEPFIGLDVYAIEFLLTIIKEKVDQGTSILLTTHQLDMLKDIADHYLLLQHGKMVRYGPIETFETIKRGFHHD